MRRIARGQAWPAARIAGLLTLALVAMLGSAGAAFAHASLMRADPADGAVVASPPARVTLSFNEPVSPLVLRLVRPDGAVVLLERAATRGSTLDITLPTGFGTGTHRLRWRVIARDGHPVSGSVAFSIGAPSAEPPMADDAGAWPLRTAIWAAKLALYAGLILGIGGAFCLAWMMHGARHGLRIAAGAMILGLAAAPLSVGLQGLDALESPLTGIGQGVIWATGLKTSFGLAAMIAMLALAAGLLSLAFRRSLIARGLSLVALGGAGAALAASGHASAAEPQWLMRPAVFLHVAGIAIWAGALMPLGMLIASWGTEASAALRSVSRVMPLAVAPMLAAGLVLAIVQVGEPGALIATAYGRLLTAKLALVAGLLALAAVNRWRLTARAEAGEPAARRHLVRSIAAETLLIVAILGLAACWRFTPPPRALAQAAALPAQIHIHTAAAMADLIVTPGRTGPVSVSIVIMTGDFGPLDARAVSLTLTPPAAGAAPVEAAARRPGDGSWHIDRIALPVPGRWRARIDILTPGGETIAIEDAIDLRP